MIILVSLIEIRKPYFWETIRPYLEQSNGQSKLYGGESISTKITVFEVKIFSFADVGYKRN